MRSLSHAVRRLTMSIAFMCASSVGIEGCGSQGRWPAHVPGIQAASREQLSLPGGAVVLFFRHTGPYESAFSGLVSDLTAGGWQILDSKGSLYSQSISGCGVNCDELRFYAVTRRMGPISETLLRVSGPTENRSRVPLEGICVSVPLAKRKLDPASRYGPLFDVDLDRDGYLDGYVPRFDGVAVVWDAYVMRGSCGHRVGTFPKLPADPHTTELGPTGLVDLTVAEPSIDKDGRRRKTPVTYRFDGARYVRPRPSPS